jgi:6-phosphogluconate dehydrogenase
MQIGVVGLGRMGLQIARRLGTRGVEVVGYDRSPEARGALAEAGGAAASGMDDLVARLATPRVVWVMVPSGAVTEEVVGQLFDRCAAGDLIVDGGNSHFKDSMRRSQLCASKGIGFVDCGTSGGIYGETTGFCLMVGGNPQQISTVESIFKHLAQEGGYLHVGPAGSGHYVKMVHNAIEYALMEAYGEGFELLAARKDFGIDLEGVARLWGNGSVVRSWLLELTAEALRKDPGLAGIKGFVADTGEGRWAALEAIEQGVPVPGIILALTQRQRSRQEDSFAAKVVAAQRREFGGHEVKNK